MAAVPEWAQPTGVLPADVPVVDAVRAVVLIRDAVLCEALVFVPHKDRRHWLPLGFAVFAKDCSGSAQIPGQAGTRWEDDVDARDSFCRAELLDCRRSVDGVVPSVGDDLSVCNVLPVYDFLPACDVLRVDRNSYHLLPACKVVADGDTDQTDDHAGTLPAPPDIVALAQRPDCCRACILAR